MGAQTEGLLIDEAPVCSSTGAGTQALALAVCMRISREYSRASAAGDEGRQQLGPTLQWPLECHPTMGF